MGLERFVDAQEKIYAIALSEIRSGYKRSHWIWYIFPQIAGLGHSCMAQSYLNHPVLGARLREISSVILMP